MVPAKSTSKTSRRNGFTLIELLIVIVVIGILAALILPAIGNSRRSVQITGVKNEINQLETAIAKFKADHGIEPPSSITLYETAAGWTGDTTGSRAIIQQIWNQFDFTNSAGWDLNNDGTVSGSYLLNGAECLVFFLGGVFKTSATGPKFQMRGFSKNPANPFDLTSTSREAPLFEFRPDRLSDLTPTNDFPEYKDSLPSQKAPYFYYSSYDGQGYATAEFPSPGGFGLTTYYTQSAGGDAWKPNSHQLISPGFDGLYGYGGPYVTTSGARLPTTASPPTAAQRAPEADNITNFSDGVLQP